VTNSAFPGLSFIAGDGFNRNFDPWAKNCADRPRRAPCPAPSIAQFSLIPLGVPIMLMSFVLILQRSGFGREFSGNIDSAVAFSSAPITLNAVSDEVAAGTRFVAKPHAAEKHGR
jgi:hypothetical protein